MKKKEILDEIGGRVDEVFLFVPRSLKHLRPRRRVTRIAYERDLDFYLDNGFVDAPETFFTLPDKAPLPKTMTSRPYQDGSFKVLSWPSLYEPKNPHVRDRYLKYENNRTSNLCFWTHGDRPRKTVLCLHGYMLGDPAKAAKMFRVRTLFERGLDVALYCAPFHWRREPGSRASRNTALRLDDVAWTAEFMGQAVYDLAATIMALKDLGAPEVGLVGASLGGYLTGLFLGLSPAPAFGAMMVPAVHFARPLGPEAFPLPFVVDQAFKEKIQKVLGLHSPLNFKPQIPKDRILVIASRGDRLCPVEFTYELCEKWDWPRHCFLTGGHWLIFNQGARGKAWYGFLNDMDY